MVTGQIMPTNPAAAVRGPLHIVRRGKTPVLDPAEARQLIDAIDATTIIGLRDRALIGLMVYSFARIGAALGMRVEDVFYQNRRLWGRCEMSLDSLPSSLRSTNGTVPPAKRPRALSSFLRSRSLGRQRQRAGRGGRGARKNGEQPHAKQIAPLREDVMGRYYRGERRREKS